MRVLFATYAVKTHFQAMVPLAWALRNAGHDVRVAGQPELVGVITKAGLTAVEVGTDHNLWRTANRFLTRRYAELNPEVYRSVREARVLPFDRAESAPGELTWDELAPAYENLVQSWYRIVNGSMVDDLVDFTRHWQPDLVIWEPNSYAAPVAAEVAGAAHARLLWGVDIFAVTRARLLELQGDRSDALGEWLAGQIGVYGHDFAETLTTGHFTIDQLPTPLRMTADLHYVRMGYVPYNGVAVVPKWLWEQPERPRVALTLGVTATESFGGYGVGVQDVLDSLADLDIEIVATVAEHEQHKLGQVPANTRIVPSVPLHALLPSCAAAIHHAGFGTLSTSLYYGVPPMSLPERFDEPLLARRVEAHGAGLQVHMAEATGDQVRAGIQRLLAEPSFRHGAESLRTEMLSMPSPVDLVAQLEELAAGYRPRPKAKQLAVTR
ncbi:glycosyltransferase (activator-dependent family) [Kibdelosporangium banguiense]|uniref:Glycosyltransferase (Activator-dependent family) n=1 Tax=Kibdelosporangium banguiense TaxID=1365924 RepID=A0ABS4TZD7_9PSEU|nr:activator-dependent family glycosyltransferase [Kibdelosporangium banguiense]MBP2329773.1 glycosyltransferase (activator-dependent family) [Kibdelosporangium banguiense]